MPLMSHQDGINYAIPLNNINKINTQRSTLPNRPITPVQQMAAATFGAIATSLFGIIL
jgi:hypothetical protein